MDTVVQVTCPKCGVVLIVDRVTGEVLETREPLVAESSGDRFQDAMQKVKQDRAEAEARFKQAQSEEKTKSQALDQLFKKSLEQAKKDDPAKPPSKDIDWE
ncbi:MAG: hypothetical protein AB1439_12265 [candidate division FCPU426 bacterium]